MNTIRKFKDGDRLILVFENTTEDERQKIAAFVGELMLGGEVKTETLPYADKPDTSNLDNQIKKDVVKVIENQNDKSTNKNNIHFVSDDKFVVPPQLFYTGYGDDTSFGNIFDGMKFKLVDQNKVYNAMTVKSDVLLNVYDALLKQEFLIEGMNKDNYLDFYKIITLFLFAKRNANDKNIIELYHIMGYSGETKEECLKNSKRVSRKYEFFVPKKVLNIK